MIFYISKRTEDYDRSDSTQFYSISKNFSEIREISSLVDRSICPYRGNVAGHESAERFCSRTAISIGLNAPLASAMCLAYFRHARPILCLRGASRPSPLLSSSRPFPTRRPSPSSSSSRWQDLVRSTDSDTPITNYQGIGRGIQTSRLIFPEPDNSSDNGRDGAISSLTRIRRE